MTLLLSAVLLCGAPLSAFGFGQNMGQPFNAGQQQFGGQQQQPNGINWFGPQTTQNAAGRTPLTPDQRIKRCCNAATPKLSQACNDHMCSYSNVDQNHIFVGHVTGRCTSAQMLEILLCAANWVDHSACCSAAGVTGACLDLCRPHAPLQPLSDDAKHLPCFMHMHPVRQCMEDYDRAHPSYA